MEALRETIKWIGTSLSRNNYTLCKQRLITAIDWCRKIGFPVSANDELDQVNELKAQYEKVVRAVHEREEQARIKARMREELLLQRDRERELQRLERERAAIKLALDTALAQARDQHSAEVDLLRQRLAEAEERSQRAISQAQLTRQAMFTLFQISGRLEKEYSRLDLHVAWSLMIALES